MLLILMLLRLLLLRGLEGYERALVGVLLLPRSLWGTLIRDD